MNVFTLEGENGYVKIELEELFGFPNETSCFGGYDARGVIQIKSSNYFVRGEIWFTTGEIYTFYRQLEKAYENLCGKIEFSNTEHQLEMTLLFDDYGKTKISGSFQEKPIEDNILQYEFQSNQSYLPSTLRDLKKFVKEYGDMEGLKNR